MDQQTADRLNLLNQNFYQKIGRSFHQTRRHFWPGWIKTLSFLKKNGFFAALQLIKVLDVGCGNGRFGKFLFQNTDCRYHYFGWDNNDFLLRQAELSLNDSGQKTFFKKIDVWKSLNNQSLKPQAAKIKANLIVAFGFLHHLPKKSRRQLFLQSLINSLDNDGYLIFTTWNFIKINSLMSRKIDPQIIGVSPEQLAKNDYILDWQQNQAYRYCHYLTPIEAQELIGAIGGKIIDDFTADGKTGDLNHYYIIQKK